MKKLTRYEREQSFEPCTLGYSDSYKLGHLRMMAKGITRLYGTWIPRSLKHIDPSITKVVSMGQQLTVRWLHDEFQKNFFGKPIQNAVNFINRVSKHLGVEYNGNHFLALHRLGFLPIRIKSLPEGIETDPNIPHMTFINTHNDFAWLTLYLETIISSLSWKTATSATLALQYKRNVTEWVMRTDPSNAWFIDYACHDFSARGLDPFSMLASGLGHAASHRGSDTLIVMEGAEYFYDEEKVPTNSVNASEHSVATTKIFTVGEKQMLIDWLIEFPTGILSVVADTFDLWKLLTEYITDPEIKELILARDGKLVIRPDSGDPVDIICGFECENGVGQNLPQAKGVIELLWDTFGGTINEQGYKVLDPNIGAIYGDSINLERQLQIYNRLEAKGFASTNIVLGIGSFTYQFNTRDTLGFAAKGAWFEDDGKGYNIFKDPITDDGTKKSLKGMCSVHALIDHGNTFLKYYVETERTKEQESKGLLQIIYENGEFSNQTTLTEIRERINQIV